MELICEHLNIQDVSGYCWFCINGFLDSENYPRITDSIPDSFYEIGENIPSFCVTRVTLIKSSTKKYSREKSVITGSVGEEA